MCLTLNDSNWFDLRYTGLAQTVTNSESIILNLYDFRGDMSCWRIIAAEEGSPGRCVFSLLWFYLHSERFNAQPYSLSTAFSKPLLLSLCNEKWLKHTLDKSDSPLSLLWTLHRFSLRKPGDDTLDNSIFSTPHSPSFSHTLFTHCQLV